MLRVQGCALACSLLVTTQLLAQQGPVRILIAISPANSSVPLGSTRQLAAQRIFIGAVNKTDTGRDLGQVTWSSSDQSVANVDQNGLLTTVSQGTTLVKVRSGPFMASTLVTVTAPAIDLIAVTPLNPSVPKGVPQAFTAMAHFTDGNNQNVTNSVSWSSLDLTVATVAANGIASTLNTG